MRLVLAHLGLFFLTIQAGFALPGEGFSGQWRFNPDRSTVRTLPAPPDAFLKIECDTSGFRIAGAAEQGGPWSAAVVYPLDGNSVNRRAGDVRFNTVTKWEGAALLVNILVSGGQNYTLMERWEHSRDGSRLTVTRTYSARAGEIESTLVYENTAVAAEPEEPQTLPTPGGGFQRAGQPVLKVKGDFTPRPVPGEPSDAAGGAKPEYLVPAGTHLLLRLTNSLNTKTATAGDRVYLETAVPIFIQGRLVVPARSYVSGTVTESHEAGRAKGRSGMNLRIDSLTLPNGVARDFRSRVENTENQGKTVGDEGAIRGAANAGGDARRVGQTTAAGAGIGSVIGAASGHALGGLGIGSAAGAAAGLASIFATRGPQTVLPRGSTLELVLDVDLRYSDADLRMPVQ
jgi:type IV secretion system protein VirB10